MKNVGFVNPSSEFLINQRVFVTLGILRVATCLRRNGVYNVFFLDLSNTENHEKLISDFISLNKLDVICFTATTPQISGVFELCKHIKRNGFKGKIILGGAHITLTYCSIHEGTDDIKDKCQVHINEILGYIDNIVIGDGEFAITDAINSDIKIINSEIDKRLFLSTNYDEVAISDRDFLDLDSYIYAIDGAKATNIISQMGCPYKCEFCSGRGSKTFNMIRKRSVGNVLQEIDCLYRKYDYRAYMIFDDEININKKYFEELLIALIDYQKKNNVSFNFRGFTRSDLLTTDQAELMYKAGFRWLLVGFESGSDRILKNINKGCSVEDNTRCFDIARKNKLKVKALMSIGHAGESFSTLNDTMWWLRDMKPDETDVTIVAVYPGSNYFNKSFKLGKGWFKYISKHTNDALYIKDVDFLYESNFYKSREDEYVSYVFTDFLSAQNIVDQRHLIHSINGKVY